MQRWILLGVVAFIVFLGGSYFGVKAYKQNRPNPIWVPLPMNVELEKEKQDVLCDQLQQHMWEKERLLKIVQDIQLAKEWSLPSDEAAAAELKKRMFIRIGKASTPMGEVSSLNVGVNGKRKEISTSEKIVQRLMKDVYPALGIPGAEKME